MKRFLFICLVLILAVSAWLFWKKGAAPPIHYRTAKVGHATIVQNVAANGRINPVTIVNVGSQVSGRVDELFADYNDIVRKGQELARIDPSVYEEQLKQAQASLAEAKANLEFLALQEERMHGLYAKDYVSKQDWDNAKSQYEVAKARVHNANAQIAQVKTNLGYTRIFSPVNGIVIARLVDVGQTLAASFETPVLFQIAPDISKMQIETSISEADIGMIQKGQKATFTVDAYPALTFAATVKEIRLNATIQQGVVFYNVVLNADNQDQKLLPAMTAYVRVEVAKKENVLAMPNAALRYAPSDAVAPKTEYSVVYKLENNKPVPVPVRAGITDGLVSEVLAGNLKEGDVLVLGEESAKQAKKGRFRFRFL
jgi:HlyD family secretion protein